MRKFAFRRRKEAPARHVGLCSTLRRRLRRSARRRRRAGRSLASLAACPPRTLVLRTGRRPAQRGRLDREIPAARRRAPGMNGENAAVSDRCLFTRAHNSVTRSAVPPTKPLFRASFLRSRFLHQVYPRDTPLALFSSLLPEDLARVPDELRQRIVNAIETARQWISQSEVRPLHRTYRQRKWRAPSR